MLKKNVDKLRKLVFNGEHAKREIIIDIHHDDFRIRKGTGGQGLTIEYDEYEDTEVCNAVLAELISEIMSGRYGDAPKDMVWLINRESPFEAIKVFASLYDYGYRDFYIDEDYISISRSPFYSIDVHKSRSSNSIYYYVVLNNHIVNNIIIGEE